MKKVSPGVPLAENYRRVVRYCWNGSSRVGTRIGQRGRSPFPCRVVRKLKLWQRRDDSGKMIETIDDHG